MKAGLNPANSPRALTHSEAQVLIQREMQTALDGGEQAALRAHLSSCPICAAHQAEVQALDQSLGLSLPARWPERRYSPAGTGKTFGSH